MKIPSHRKYSPFALIVLLSFAASAAVTFFVPDFRNTLIQGISYNNAPDSIEQRRQPPADSLYNQLINLADQYLKEKKLEKCLAELEKAQKIKPYDPVLKDRIMKTRALLNNTRAKTAEYQKAMSAGDQYFSTKDYINAKAYYQMALGQLPEDTAATRKLKKTMEMLRASKARNILYDVAVASADRLFQEKEYERARVEYENAGKILPDEQYPKTKINEIIKIQVDQQAIEEEYTLSVTAADKFFGIKAYAPALKEYKKANTIKPQEKYPLDRIAELTAIITAQQAKEDAYNKAIAGADQLFKKFQLQEARKGYQQALTIKPEENYPKDKIVEIETLIARSTKEKEDYERYVNLADSLYIEKQYLQAKRNYQLAATVKPKENYPREMISKSDQMIAGQDDALMKSIKDQYTNAITEGDKLLAARQYSKSQIAFRKATGLKPLEQYPKEKLAELEGLILDENYNGAVKKGDSLLAGQTYQGALDAYQSALKLKPAEAYPKGKVAEINGVLAKMAEQARLDKQYQEALARADQSFTGKLYPKAKTDYEAALALHPGESYPKVRIASIDSILGAMAAAKALDEQYRTTIVKADQLLAAKTYDQARGEYVKAGNLKPEEEYPRTKIGEIDRLVADVAARKALDEQYAGLITKADQQMTEKQYETARAAYQEASGLKPSEAYPKTKIAAIDQLLGAMAAQKRLDENYASTIKKGDSLLAGQTYQGALDAYQAALKLKPAEAYPKGKVAEINGVLAKMAEQAHLDKQYQETLARADQSFTGKLYPKAKTDYEAALALRPGESYPKTRIASIDSILGAMAAAKALDEQYRTTIVKADQLLAAKTYDQARGEYVKAGNLKPEEEYPRTKIGEIDRLVADVEARKALDEQYSGLIAKADQQMTEKQYEPARAAYQEASGLKSSEAYPKTKIAAIDQLLGAMAAQRILDDNYSAAIKKGDSLLAGQTYQGALDAYQAALKLKPAEAYPKGKVAEINGVLAKMAEQARLDKQYQDVLARADQSFTGKLYPKAKTDYEAALALRPGESYPKTRIASIDSILGAMAATKALDEQYRTTIVKADQLLAAKTYDQARGEYVKAGNLKPEEEYPRTKIGEIDRLVADVAARKALDEQYAGLITKADQQMTEKQYETARAAYQEASGLKPSEAYPKTKIAAIDQLLGAMAAQRVLDDNYSAAIKKGDSLLAGQGYQGALDAYQAALKLKPGETYPKGKVAEITGVLAKMAEQARLDKQYQEALARADQSFTGKLYPKAKTDYEAALALRPGENYPKTRIASIDSIMGAMAAAKALDEQYQATIVKADQLLAAKTYDQARGEYEKAGNLKPEEEYPRTKIGEIDRLVADAAARKALDEQYTDLIAKADQQMADKKYEMARGAYQEASGLKPSEAYPKTKIAAIDKLLEEIALQKKLNEQYTAAIRKGDSLFGAKLFEQAKAEFVTASSLKPTETYPKTKISEVDGFIAAANKSRELDNRYRNTVENADKLFAEKQYDLAMSAYQEAGKIKPAEQYPKDQLKAISAKLKELALQKELDEKYTAAVNRGDQNFSKSSYELALVEYENALKLKPQEKYPADKISEIHGIMEEIKAREDQYNTAILSADGLLTQKKYEEARTAYQNALTIKPEATYPKEKLLAISKALEELLGKQKLYENLLTSGDGQIRDKDFVKAKETFTQAQTLFPDEKYPKDRLNFITYRLDSIFRANKALYDKAVGNGDRYYAGFEFDKAIDAFTQASELLPGENYPREMIVKIRRTIAENTIADVLKTPVVIESGAEKQFSFTPVNIASRKNNFIYLKLKNLSGKPFNVMMRYGKDKQPNGGVVIRNVSGDGKINERLVSVKDQDLWYRADNNWISLYPQGGDVEVSFIQVSRAK